MCRNIHTLFNYEPPATEEEVRDAALQYVRKISGSTKPSRANEEAFSRMYRQLTGETKPFEELVYEKKRLILQVSLCLLV